MVSKTILVLILAGFSAGFCMCQQTTTKSEFLNYQTGIGVETFYQSNYGLALGGLIGKNIGQKSKPNYAIGIYADAILVNSPIVGPRAKLSYNYLGIFGLNLNFSNYFRNGLNDFRITPEVNFTLFGVGSIFAGYSLKVSKDNFSEINEFRLGLNLGLVNRK